MYKIHIYTHVTITCNNHENPDCIHECQLNIIIERNYVNNRNMGQVSLTEQNAGQLGPSTTRTRRLVPLFWAELSGMLDNIVQKCLECWNARPRINFFLNKKVRNPNEINAACVAIV